MSLPMVPNLPAPPVGGFPAVPQTPPLAIFPVMLEAFRQAQENTQNRQMAHQEFETKQEQAKTSMQYQNELMQTMQANRTYEEQERKWLNDAKVENIYGPLSKIYQLGNDSSKIPEILNQYTLNPLEKQAVMKGISIYLTPERMDLLAKITPEQKALSKSYFAMAQHKPLIEALSPDEINIIANENYSLADIKKAQEIFNPSFVISKNLTDMQRTQALTKQIETQTLFHPYEILTEAKKAQAELLLKGAKTQQIEKGTYNLKPRTQNMLDTINKQVVQDQKGLDNTFGFVGNILANPHSLLVRDPKTGLFSVPAPPGIDKKGKKVPASPEYITFKNLVQQVNQQKGNTGILKPILDETVKRLNQKIQSGNLAEGETPILTGTEQKAIYDGFYSKAQNRLQQYKYQRFGQDKEMEADAQELQASIIKQGATVQAFKQKLERSIHQNPSHPQADSWRSALEIVNYLLSKGAK